ncbi:hypothetical protein A2U01_0106922, partial [Trifolium medium]|nr:hypothetical protein [Trifolium medium]
TEKMMHSHRLKVETEQKAANDEGLNDSDGLKVSCDDVQLF